MIEIVTSSDVEDYLVDEMAQNIADAIVYYTGGQGITPEDSDAYTEIVYVKELHSDNQIIEHV